MFVCQRHAKSKRERCEKRSPSDRNGFDSDVTFLLLLFISQCFLFVSSSLRTSFTTAKILQCSNSILSAVEGCRSCRTILWSFDPEERTDAKKHAQNLFSRVHVLDFVERVGGADKREVCSKYS